MKNSTRDIFGLSKNILREGIHFIALPVKVASSIISADVNNQKIVPAGTIITKLGALMTAADANAADAFGVLYEDLDLTGGNETASVVVHGVVLLSQLPVAPTTAQAAAMKLVLFV